MKDWHWVRMHMCAILSQKSTCWKKHTAAILCRNHRILSEGYNGVPSGQPHCQEVGPRDRVQHRVWSRVHEIHGEINAIRLAAAYGHETRGSTLYTLLSPCNNCADAIIRAGIIHVVYSEVYRPEPLERLSDAGIAITRIKIND